MTTVSIRRASERVFNPSVATEELNDPHSLATHALTSGSCVLDVGCGTGDVGRRLLARGCRVFGVEIDARAAEAAENHCERVILGDVEALDLAQTFPSIRFDAVLFLDVLEHLREPGRLLRQVQRILAPNGRVLASIPNVTHGAVRLQLLHGQFRYAESGLLDRGHLRFFDAQSVESLFSDTGYEISQRLRIERGLAETEIPIDVAAIPSEVLRSLEADPDALTYQFFIIASPKAPVALQLPIPPERNLVEAHRLQVRELVRLVREGESYRKKLERELADKEAHIASLEHMVHQHAEAAAYTRKLEGEFSVKEAEIRRLESAAHQHEEDAAYARKLEAELTAKETQIGALEHAVRQHEESAAQRYDLEEELTRKTESLRDLETELRARIAEIEAAHEERTCLERELLIGSEYNGELRSELARSEARLGDLQTRIQALEGERQEAEALKVDLLQASNRVTWLEDVVQQPRHLLSDRLNSWMKRRVPPIHRLLRPLVLRLWRRERL